MQQSQASLNSTAGDPPSPIKPPFGDSYFITRNVSLESSVDSSAGSLDNRLEKALQTAKLVDTTLFMAYMYSKPTLVGSLVRQQNLCDPLVVNERLKETGRFHDLVDFFGGKKLHREALTLLKQYFPPLIIFFFLLLFAENHYAGSERHRKKILVPPRFMVLTVQYITFKPSMLPTFTSSLNSQNGLYALPPTSAWRFFLLTLKTLSPFHVERC